MRITEQNEQTLQPLLRLLEEIISCLRVQSVCHDVLIQDANKEESGVALILNLISSLHSRGNDFFSDRSTLNVSVFLT